MASSPSSVADRGKLNAPPLAAPIAIDAPFRAAVDRCGYLLAKYHENKNWLDELDDLKSEIRARYSDQDPEAGFRVLGVLYFVDLTPKENQRKVTAPGRAFAALRKIVGLEKLLSRITITLKLIDEFVPKDRQGAFVSQARTGSRDISGGLLNPPQAA